MKLFPAIDNFFGGYVSRMFSGRVRHPKYNNSLLECINWKITKTGGLSKRAGFRYSKAASGDIVKLFPFKIRGQEDLVVEVSKNYIKVYNLSGDILVTSGAYIQTNGNFANGLTGWTKKWRKDTIGYGSPSSNDVTYNSYSEFLSSSGQWPYYTSYTGGHNYADPESALNAMGQSYTVVGTGIRLAKFSVAEQLSTLSEGGLLQYSVANIYNYTDCTSFVQSISNPTQIHTLAFSVGAYQQSLGSNGKPAVSPTWGVFVSVFNASTDAYITGFTDITGTGTRSWNFTPGAGVLSVRIVVGFHSVIPATSSYNFYRQYPSGTPWSSNCIYTSAVFSDFTMRDTSVVAGSAVSFTSPYLEEDIPHVQSDYNSSTREIWFFHKGYEPRRLQQAISTDTWGFTNPIGSAVRPTEWTTNNWPASCAFHQGRLFCGGGNANSSTIYASKSGSFADFTVGSSADSALKFVMTSSGQINALQSQEDLIIHTTNGDSILSASNGLVTASDFQFNRQNNVPSDFIQGSRVGAGFVYAMRGKKSLRLLDYDGQSRLIWLSKDLCSRASDVLAGGLTQLAYSPEPDSSIFCARQDGGISVCRVDTFDPTSEDTHYWYNYEISGDAISICATQDSTGGSVWIAKRFNGTTVIEVLRDQEDHGICLDSYSAVTLDGSGVGSGLSRFNGLYVNVVVNPVSSVPLVYGPFLVSAGSVSCGSGLANTTVYVGLGYSARCKTVKLEGLSQEGSSQTDVRRNAPITLRLVDSCPPNVNGNGPTFEYTDEPSDLNQPMLMDGDVVYSSEGSDDFISITHNIPLRCEVLAVFPESTSNNE